LKTGSMVTAETFGSGAGGKVTISADQRVTVADSFILTSAVPEFGEGGSGGDIVLNAPTLSLEGSGLFASTSSTGKAGDVALQGQQITLASNSVVATSTDGQGAAGTIKVEGLQGSGSRATSVTLSNSRIESETTGNLGSEGPAGNIFVETARLTLTDSQLSTRSSFSPGNAGQLVMNASNQIQLVRSNITSSSEGAVTDAVTGDPIQTGDAGKIVMSAPHIIVEDASKVTTNTEFTGQAGNITLNTANLEVRSGAQITSSSSAPESSTTGNAGTVTVQDLASLAQSVLIDGLDSGIFTDTQGTGAGGNIFVNANSVTLQNGGTLSAATSGTAPSATGGTITVDANQVQLNSGGLITASTTGAGAGGSIMIAAGSTFASNAGTVSSTAAQAQGGDINITAGQSVTLNNGSLITASSTGHGDAGNILINAGQNYTSTNSAVTTQATALGTEASGGNIKVLATDMVQLTNSQLNASVQGSSTTVGGNITIDPLYVMLQNSQILAQATQGQGGAISITITNGGLFLPDANSTISASSQFGVNGTITIQSPNAPISGQIQPLGKTPLIATSLLNQHCASLAGGEFSSFTVAGRDSLPTEPGSWLASPLYAAGVGLGIKAEGGKTEGARLEGLSASAGQVVSGQWRVGDRQILSLRQIAPAGFLTQAFAVEGASSCQS
jgi:large exoprotein involved in heme utilization and adhesion